MIDESCISESRGTDSLAGNWLFSMGLVVGGHIAGLCRSVLCSLPRSCVTLCVCCRLSPNMAALTRGHARSHRPLKTAGCRSAELECCGVRSGNMSPPPSAIADRKGPKNALGFWLDLPRFRPETRVFVANLQHGPGKGVANCKGMLPPPDGWIVSPQAADRRPLFLGGQQRGGGQYPGQATWTGGLK